MQEFVHRCIYCFIEQEAVNIVNPKQWPPLYDIDDLPKKKLSNIHHCPTPEMICYLDFSVSTTGMLAGIKVIITVKVYL